MLSSGKSREGKKKEKLGRYRLQEITLDDGQTSCVVVPVGKSSPNQPDEVDDAESELTLNADQTTALKLVAQAGDKGVRRSDVMTGADLTDNGTTAVLKHLLNLKFISQEVKRKPYVITEAGQTFLEQGNNPTD